MTRENQPSPPEGVERLILQVRGQRVLLDADLAELYGVATRRLNEQVSRNLERFPDDFMFRLTHAEWSDLKSQVATSSEGHGGRRKLPRVFTEQGVAMLSSVLKSRRAAEVNIAIMRAFVQLRQLAARRSELVRRLDDLERRVGAHDDQFRAVFRAIRKLIEGPTAPQRKRIGFEED